MAQIKATILATRKQAHNFHACRVGPAQEVKWMRRVLNQRSPLPKLRQFFTLEPVQIGHCEAGNDNFVTIKNIRWPGFARWQSYPVRSRGM